MTQRWFYHQELSQMIETALNVLIFITKMIEMKLNILYFISWNVLVFFIITASNKISLV